jgi:hypothetical protein
VLLRVTWGEQRTDKKPDEGTHDRTDDGNGQKTAAPTPVLAESNHALDKDESLDQCRDHCRNHSGNDTDKDAGNPNHPYELRANE